MSCASQGLIQEITIETGGVLATISDGTGDLVAQIPRAQLQGRDLPEVGQGLKVTRGLAWLTAATHRIALHASANFIHQACMAHSAALLRYSAAAP